MMPKYQAAVFLDHIRGSATQCFINFESTQLEVQFTKLEYIALNAIYEYFSGIEDKQLKAICVLGYLPQY